MDFLGEKQQEIETRLGELAPLVAEHARLEQAAALLDKLPGASPNGAADMNRLAAAAGPRRRRASGTPASAPAAVKRRGGKKKVSGKRSVEALALIHEQPGITPRELAEKMGTAATYVYHLLSALAKDGKIAKQGRGWEASAA